MFRSANAPIWVVGTFLLVSLAFAWPLPLHMTTHLLGDPGGDTGVYVWNQWVFFQEVTHGRNPLTTAAILALTPEVDLSQHNYTAFLDLLALPLIPWLGVVASFNVVFISICVINAVAAYGLSRVAMGAGRWESWLSGLAFAWSPVLMARSTGHYSLLAAAPLAAFVWALIVAERSRSYRRAAMVGVCMAWAAFCDPYFAVYCVLIAGLYIVSTVVRVRRAEANRMVPWTWLLDVLIVSIGGLIVGMIAGARGVISVMGVNISVRELYTPTLALTLLVGIRMAIAIQPRFEWIQTPQPKFVKLALMALVACAGPLSPILYGLGQRAIDGTFVSPPTYWRSSPAGVDLLGLISPNPNNPAVRSIIGDWQSIAPTQFVEYVASVSLVALAIVVLARWRAGFRPKAGWWWLTIGFAALSLGPFIHIAGYNTHIPGPWALLRYVPVIGIARTPSRFAIVTALGLAILAAGALSSLLATWPNRRRLLLSAATAALLLELSPWPRQLHSGAISPIYDTIAADARPVRVLNLPSGVRDGTSSIGNFGARSQFNQTRHGKQLIGGYLSRVSTAQVQRLRSEYPTLSVLIKLSEGTVLAAEDVEVLRNRGRNFVRRSNIGYVVLDLRFVTEAKAAPVVEHFGLTELQRDGDLVLYAPRLSG